MPKRESSAVVLRRIEIAAVQSHSVVAVVVNVIRFALAERGAGDAEQVVSQICAVNSDSRSALGEIIGFQIDERSGRFLDPQQLQQIPFRAELLSEDSVGCERHAA